MNTFTFGRVDKMKVDVNGWQMDGDEVRVEGFTEYGTYADAIAIRNQLVGYGLGKDEDVVPIVWDDRPENNGYYQVLGISTQEDTSRAPFGVIDWSMNLYRIAGFSAPLIEATVVGGTRTNTRQVESLWYFGVPGSARSFIEYDPITTTFYPAQSEEREAEGGKTVLVYQGGQRIKQYYVDPANYYDGAVTLTVGGYKVIGRRAKNAPGDWSINNGIFKIRADATGGVFRLIMNTYQPNTDTWSADWSVDVQGAPAAGSTADMVAPHTITVLRNSPEEVVLRFMTTQAASKDPITVDMSVKRGSYFASMRINSTFPNKMGIQPVAGMSGWLGFDGGWMRGWLGSTTSINVVKNPSAQFDATGFTNMAGNGGRQSTGAGGGSGAYDIAVYRATATSSHSAAAFGIRVGSTSTDQIPVVAGTTYRFSAYGMCSVGKTMTLALKFWNSGGAQVGSTVTSSSQVMTGGTWYRFNCAATAAPVGAVRATLEFQGNTSWVSGEYIQIDAVLGEPTSALNTYFDGNTRWGGGLLYAWEGAVGASRSFSYAASGTDGGQFIIGPKEIAAAASQFTPSEGGVTQVDSWDVAIGMVPNNRSVDLRGEVQRYFWATSDRAAVVAQ